MLHKHRGYFGSKIVQNAWFFENRVLTPARTRQKRKRGGDFSPPLHGIVLQKSLNSSENHFIVNGLGIIFFTSPAFTTATATTVFSIFPRLGLYEIGVDKGNAYIPQHLPQTLLNFGEGFTPHPTLVTCLRKSLNNVQLVFYLLDSFSCYNNHFHQFLSYNNFFYLLIK
jgi:hypothetical protein